MNSDKELRSGFTTGSCAAAAASAALEMLIQKKEIHNVRIMTPKGIPYDAQIIDIDCDREGNTVSCAVIKDAGDDPDVTDGAKIVAGVSLTDNPGIVIKGGKGVGRITKKGLDQPVGEAAINSVPRKMIRENLSLILQNYGITDKGAEVVISVPEGEAIAKKTFNPRLGIEGGISILGTTGIVEPMSDEAIIDTIKVQLRVKKAEGRDELIVAPGNYGLTFLRDKYNIDEDDVVLCSNSVYDTLRLAIEEGFGKMLFVGHIGKLIKVAGGIKNTHSRYGDHRMEILSEFCEELRPELLECVMTDEAVQIIKEAGYGKRVFNNIADRIKENMQSWTDGKMQVEVLIFSNNNSELAATDHTWRF